MKTILIHVPAPFAVLLPPGLKQFEPRPEPLPEPALVLVHAHRPSPQTSKLIQQPGPLRDILHELGYKQTFHYPTGQILGGFPYTTAWKVLGVDSKGQALLQHPNTKQAKVLDPVETQLGSYRPGMWAWEIVEFRKPTRPLFYNKVHYKQWTQNFTQHIKLI